MRTPTRFCLSLRGATEASLPGGDAKGSAIHSLRATGITDYLESAGTLEHAQAMANHSSPRTTKLYDRRNDEASLDEYEKVGM